MDSISIHYPVLRVVPMLCQNAVVPAQLTLSIQLSDVVGCATAPDAEPFFTPPFQKIWCSFVISCAESDGVIESRLALPLAPCRSGSLGWSDRVLPVIVVVSSPAENSVELSCHTSPTVRKGGRSARFVQQTVARRCIQSRALVGNCP